MSTQTPAAPELSVTFISPPRSWDEFFNYLQGEAYDKNHPGDEDGPGAPDGDTQTLYVYLDSNDQVLYVGITNNLPTRLRAHERSSNWFCRADTYRWRTWVCCRACLCHMEHMAIALLSPIHNKAA